MELKETVKFKEPCRLVWTVVCSRVFGGSVKLHYRDITSDNPDSRDYSALSVSLVNFTKRIC